MDAPECHACGRWASVFDLERGAQDDTAATNATEPDPVVVAEPHSSTAERGRRVLDVLRDEGDSETEAQQRRICNFVRWLFVALAVLWFVLVPLLDALR